MIKKNIYVYIYIYIYIEREREREREIYIYIYTPVDARGDPFDTRHGRARVNTSAGARRPLFREHAARRGAALARA